MSFEIMPFKFNNVELQLVTVDGKPSLRLSRVKDVCQAVEYCEKTKTAHVIRQHCSPENFVPEVATEQSANNEHRPGLDK